LVLIAVVVAIAMAVTGKGVAENVFNWKFPLAIGTVLGGYVLISAKTKKFGPFKESPPRQYWGCERKGDFYTGKCIEYTNEKTKVQYGPYKSEQDCVEGVRNGDCGQYWGCELDSSGSNYTGRCKEYTNKEVATAPYASELACKTSKNCRQYWDCEKDEQGFTTGNGCKQVDISVIPIDKDMRATKEECEDKMECSQHWGLQINGIPYSADNPCEQKITNKDAGCVSKADCIARKGSC
jgi:hypothetical protein